MIELLSNKIILEDGYEIREYLTDKGTVRALVFDECIQSIIYIDEDLRDSLVADYFNYYNILIDLNPNGVNCLMLGGGAVAYPHYYMKNYPLKNMDIVEIDNKCIEYAKKYFYLDQLLEECHNKLNIVVDDALNYISTTEKNYDYILIDLFEGKKPICEIYSSDYRKRLKSILNDNGVIVINYILGFSDAINYLSDIAELASNYKIITIENSFDFTKNIGNIIIILSNNDIIIPSKYSYKDISYLLEKNS